MKTLRAFFGGDYTPLEHALYATVIQCVFGSILCLWLPVFNAFLAGGCAGVGFFAGREHAQAEDVLRDKVGQRKAEIRALRFWNWDRGSQWDLYAPIIACAFVQTFFYGMYP